MFVNKLTYALERSFIRREERGGIGSERGGIGSGI